jgi:hypothetical protein
MGVVLLVFAALGIAFPEPTLRVWKGQVRIHACLQCGRPLYALFRPPYPLLPIILWHIPTPHLTLLVPTL